MAWMYSPRGVFVGDQHLVVADSGNHRVLIWHDMPCCDEQPADVVLGQPDGETEGHAAGGRGPERGMNLPTGVLVHDGRLIVADGWHHRILVWNSVPETSDVAPDLVLGQPDASSVSENRGGECSASTLYWPFGIAVVGSTFWVADTGNRRVLGWRNGIPDPDQPADIVLGQPDAASREENRGAAAGPEASAGRTTSPGTTTCCSSPTPVTTGCWAGRRSRRPTAAPTWCLGQPDFASADEWPYGPHTNDRFRFPYAACLDTGGRATGSTPAWRSPTPPTTASCCGTACPSTVAAPIMFWRNMISAPTARTAGPRCSGTPCAGPTGCRCAVTRWRWPTRGTTG